ncbi:MULTISPECIES: hypothetical protein [unclassified Microcoleus]|uniref:hypothetical protein n=1 Tax=unclassified Microcoleus TaxID=2642155 RepID=UPI002FCF25F6
MEPVTMTAGAIATLVLIKATETATEKATEKLGKLVVEKGDKLLSLLKIHSQSTATAIALSQQKPLDYNQAVLELETAKKKYPEVAKAVEEVNTEVNASPETAEKVQSAINYLNSQPSNSQNFINTIEKSVNLVQGTGSSINISGNQYN